MPLPRSPTRHPVAAAAPLSGGGVVDPVAAEQSLGESNARMKTEEENKDFEPSMSNRSTSSSFVDLHLHLLLSLPPCPLLSHASSRLPHTNKTQT